MIKNIVLLFVFIFSAFSGSALVFEYSVLPIPDSLKENAYSIVRDLQIEYVQKDINNATLKMKKVITVLNKHGEGAADFREWGDRFREIKSFSGVVYDATGKAVRQIKKSDLVKSSFSNSLGSDDYSMLYSCRPLTYPFTVVYSWEVVLKKGIINYPPFMPQNRLHQALQKASYRLELPEGVNLRYKANYDCNLTEEHVAGKHIYSLSQQGMKAIPMELFAPYDKMIPMVLFAPIDFNFDSYAGNMGSWKNYGLWVTELLKDRDVLPESFVSELKALTQDAESDREKAKILYEYLQKNTRYVSVQLGIGGFQPDFASNVLKMKFGDCKGLSNLMKAMLKAVGISSNYCEISMRYKDLYRDYTNVSQTDHAILFIPLENDSIWLECTSKTLPFGYIHERIAGHDALVIHEDGRGGEIVRLPDYPNEERNKTVFNVELYIDETGGVKGNVDFTEYLHCYSQMSGIFTSVDRKHHVGYLNRRLKFPQMQVGKVETSEVRSASPSCRMQADFTATDFVNKTQSRLFVPLSPLKKLSSNMFTSDKRLFDIEIDFGGSDVDTIVIHLPEGYVVEHLPEDIDVESDFGKIRIQTSKEGDKVTCIQYVEIYSGRYDKSVYKDLKDFFTRVVKETDRKLILRKV
ncbi:DUF3857 and transglutaminase domain-containing protein [Porphyromonadaceae bacterium OttesenSCG-928-L07]|nr:DUF3857 and transglutaminase domain-containing protein [Porphyromonadaceae bacterium OttesenSCG-928-L07]MDL2251796.1 DUF3857 and transglutaminase domain-containing protein [Odoribacter sp. OttesenSCG-928-J03]MDL2330859.1 DUF3857 and transglutaminase domain-containing protein [Odoribacter sp. OttesenSCG-928-A06]